MAGRRPLTPREERQLLAVTRKMAEHGVIPLNSPAYYPRYNGAIEKGIREIKRALGECLVRPVRWQPTAVLPYVLAVQHALNCQQRRSLHGHTACEAYHHQPHARGWLLLSGYGSTRMTEYINWRRLIDAASAPPGASRRKPGSAARV